MSARSPYAAAGPGEWVRDAACIDSPDHALGILTPQVRALCGECPVLLECGAYAHQIRPELGIWAGQRWEDGALA